MKPLSALGLALVLVGALVLLAVRSLQPVGGALALCGAALVVYGFLRPRGARAKRPRRPYSWEDDAGARRPEMYVPNPGEMRVRDRQPTQAPEFTVPHPGSIPLPREAAHGGSAEYQAPEDAEVPPPRDRGRTAAEYSPPPTPADVDNPRPEPAAGSTYVPDLLNSENPDMPPMAPPPPRT